jgi:hypothetical protein
MFDSGDTTSTIGVDWSFLVPRYSVVASKEIMRGIKKTLLSAWTQLFRYCKKGEAKNLKKRKL